MKVDASGRGTPTVTRPTGQCRAVEVALGSSDGFRNAQSIHDLLRRDGEKIGLATVYRALQSLADSGGVDVVRTDPGRRSTDSAAPPITTTWSAGCAAGQ